MDEILEFIKKSRKEKVAAKYQFSSKDTCIYLYIKSNNFCFFFYVCPIVTRELFDRNTPKIDCGTR